MTAEHSLITLATATATAYLLRRAWLAMKTRRDSTHPPCNCSGNCRKQRRVN
ncbi:MAG: hypothetical protein LBD14_01595 [Puniceicoccales bacterium]|jgi:hypothetical protein|nr:hypothetical protein [Puniceicoccales bacterium]